MLSIQEILCAIYKAEICQFAERVRIFRRFFTAVFSGLQRWYKRLELKIVAQNVAKSG